MRASGILLVLTLITSCFVGGTFAKYISEGQGEDSVLGDKAAFAEAGEVAAGLYIVAIDNPNDPDDPNNPDNPNDPDDPNDLDDPYTYPHVPQTGDSSNIMFYLVLMAVSGVLLLLLLLDRGKAKQ